MIYDDVIMRTIIDLPEQQGAALSEFCESAGISRAEAVRRALAKMLADADDVRRQEAFGAWKDHPIDPVEHVSRLREEWDR